MLFQLLKTPEGIPGPEEALRALGATAARLIPVRTLLRSAVKIMLGILLQVVS